MYMYVDFGYKHKAVEQMLTRSLLPAVDGQPLAMTSHGVHC